MSKSSLLARGKRIASPCPTNCQVAAALQEIGELLELRAANPYRVAAYRNAAALVRRVKRPLAEIYQVDGREGLERLPGIGESLGRRIGELLASGHSKLLARLRRKHVAADPLTSLPGVGPRLAQRIRGSLGSDSLDELFVAAYDGRLRRIAGLGRKRVQGMRESLALRLQRKPPSSFRTARLAEPPVSELLAIDEEYHRQALAGRLIMAAPRQFNPTGAAWLPVLRTRRLGRNYSAHFANTARSHQLGRQRDWVVIYCQDKEAYGQWTVVTATHGDLAGRRVVRSRESECREHFRQARRVQLPLLAD